MIVLGIETSCDETGLALVEDGLKILGTQTASSLEQHRRYGGVVPEIASRAHVELMTVELEALMRRSEVAPERVGRIAVTAGPGLAGSLLVGIAAAKALGMAWGREVVGVHHLHAHLYAAWMGARTWGLQSPTVGLVVSGGHTALLRMEGFSHPVLIGQTRDDAVGEAFDKVAKLLGLGFPGGPEIERVAQEGDPDAFSFSAPRMKGGSEFDFSFSGIKTAVLYQVRDYVKGAGDRGDGLPSDFVADMAASFQKAVVEELVEKTKRLCARDCLGQVAVGGGVAANRLLRGRLEEMGQTAGIRIAVAPMDLCTDNGAMIAGLGFRLPASRLEAVTALPNWPVDSDG